MTELKDMPEPELREVLKSIKEYAEIVYSNIKKQTRKSNIDYGKP